MQTINIIIKWSYITEAIQFMTGREDKKENDLFFLCSLIDYIGRKTKNYRSTVVNALGIKELQHIRKYAAIPLLRIEVADQLLAVLLSDILWHLQLQHAHQLLFAHHLSEVGQEHLQRVVAQPFGGECGLGQS